MRQTHDLGQLEWQLAGFTPHTWRGQKSMEVGFPPQAEVAPVPARVPGSVQQALRDAGLLPDWNVGLDSRLCEWVEHRHWMYQVRLPDEWVAGPGACRLVCLGLDGPGWVFLNGREVARFDNAFVPHAFDLSGLLRAEGNTLQIVFDAPPRWLGQCGWTSRMTEWKPRFNYTWDWLPRLVQVGIWDGLFLERSDGQEIASLRAAAEFDERRGLGALRVRGQAAAGEGSRLRLRLFEGGKEFAALDQPASALDEGVAWDDLPVRPWQPNGMGDQPLYQLACELRDAGGQVLDRRALRVGFKSVRWLPCRDASPAADPWVCCVNGRTLFLQGVNWTPIRPNFADVTAEQYRQRLTTYRDLGCNVLRVWGGAVLEREAFYDLCDELGLMVWQEMPLSSSGLENWPPEDEASIAAMEGIAASYVARRQHHACLLMWCGGNELQGSLDGGKEGVGKPIDMSHPMMARLGRLIEREDAGRRFVPSSSSGPRFIADAADFGKNLHWDVHGPWRPPGATEDDWRRYWADDDALFRSELGAPGASPPDVIAARAGNAPATPGHADNPLWSAQRWWIDWPDLQTEHGREPADLAEYVRWSQARQAAALRLAVAACKRRFPAIGGVILWMGHDAFPCMVNTAILDFHGRPKPAALAVAEVFRTPAEEIAPT